MCLCCQYWIWPFKVTNKKMGSVLETTCCRAKISQIWAPWGESCTYCLCCRNWIWPFFRSSQGHGYENEMGILQWQSDSTISPVTYIVSVLCCQNWSFIIPFKVVEAKLIVFNIQMYKVENPSSSGLSIFYIKDIQ